MKRLRASSGVTIFEMMAAMGVISIVAVIAIPGIMSIQDSLRLSDARRQLASDLQLARMKAISQHTKYRVTFGSLPSSAYSIEKHDGVVFANESGPFVLPDGITVTAVSPSVSEFQPRGSVNTASTITLSNGGASKTVEINLIGRVRVP